MITGNTHAQHTTDEADARELNPAAHVEQARFSLWDRLRRPRTLASFAVSIILVVVAFRGLRIDLATALNYISRASPWMLLLGLGFFYLTFPLRALRWRLLLQNAGVPVDEGRTTWASFPALLEYLYLSWFVNCIVPAKLGDAYRGYLLKRNGQIAFSTSIGTIFAERLLDMLGLFGMLLVAAWFTFGSHLPEGSQVVFGLGALLAIMILMGLFGMRYCSPLIRRLLPQRLGEYYGRFEHAALNSFRLALLPKLLLFTGLVWILEGFRLFFVLQALGPEVAVLSFSAILFVALAFSLLTALPITPAGLGVVEGTITVVLTFFGINQNLGVAVTLLDRLINFWSIVIGGFCLYLVSKRK